MSSILLFTITLLSVALSTLCSVTLEPMVQTNIGKVLGKTLDVDGTLVEAYLGIPFAEAPIGNLRFRAPVAKEPWNEILNGTVFGAGCWMIPDETFGDDFWGSNMWNPTERLHENCLNLNLWVPSPRPEGASVMIWIYGGSFYSGVSSLDVYDGRWLAAEEQVIVVSMNYRMGAFGFLTLGDENAPGNQGLMDQALAFRWVQDNIALFGGDPNSVTIWGESAGAASVSHHMLSPVSRDLFHRAILQSSTSTAPWAYFTMDEGIKRSRALAGFVGCDPEGSSVEIIACLEKVDYQEILFSQFDVMETFLDFPFVPVIDGTFLPETPSTAFERHAFKPAEILLGSNLNEAMFFLIYEIVNFNRTLETLFISEPLLTRDQYLESLKNVFGATNSFGLDAIAFQYTDWLDPYDPVKLRYAVDFAAGDYFFTCSTYDMAKAYSSAGNNVYYYRFMELPSASPWPEWMGVLHGDEIMYAFGYPLKPGTGYSEDEKTLSRKMMRYWANFARTGDPNSPEDEFNGPEWPLYTDTGQYFLTLDEDINKGIAVTGRGPRADKCAFFREYLPRLETQTADIKEAELTWKEEFDKWRTEYMVNWKAEFDHYVNNKNSECSGHRGPDNLG
ncbi:Acetylcholinesterase [Holothuria leucospilota]|uniref:Carboxylic ester hydrolase n=1 Tax=Holothuria leucospilota TaxID=206669 RepID=A0A9Q1BQ64_HOLLE|nr:Acetylcholinesterase [Holothuria leucospilota]